MPGRPESLREESSPAPAMGLTWVFAEVKSRSTHSTIKIRQTEAVFHRHKQAVLVQS